MKRLSEYNQPRRLSLKSASEKYLRTLLADLRTERSRSGGRKRRRKCVVLGGGTCGGLSTCGPAHRPWPKRERSLAGSRADGQQKAGSCRWRGTTMITATSTFSISSSPKLAHEAS